MFPLFTAFWVAGITPVIFARLFDTASIFELLDETVLSEKL